MEEEEEEVTMIRVGFALLSLSPPPPTPPDAMWGEGHGLGCGQDSDHTAKPTTIIVTTEFTLKIIVMPFVPTPLNGGGQIKETNRFAWNP